MMVKVIDASAVGALLFGEPGDVDRARRLTGGTPVAPALLPFWVTNSPLKKMRRYPDPRASLTASFWPFKRLAVDLLGAGHQALLQLAEPTRLTAHDAGDRWLARTLGAEPVAFDAALETAHASFK